MANEEIKAANLQSVLKTSYNLFKKHGIEQVTKEQISRESGLSRRTIDRYFTTKKDCVLQTMEMYLSNTDYDIECHFTNDMFMDGHYTAADLLERYMVETKKMFVKNVKHFAFYTEFKLYVYRNCRRGDKGYELIKGHGSDGNLCQKIFMLGSMDGTLRIGTDIETEDEYFRDSFIGYLSMLALASDSYTKAELESRVDKRISNTLALYRIDSACADCMAGKPVGHTGDALISQDPAPVRVGFVAGTGVL